MRNEKFEWDNHKAAINEHKHGVSFEEAAEALQDEAVFDWVDRRKDYGEKRINALGMCNRCLLHVTYTKRGNLFRIISARKAEKYEYRKYHHW